MQVQYSILLAGWVIALLIDQANSSFAPINENDRNELNTHVVVSSLSSSSLSSSSVVMVADSTKINHNKGQSSCPLNCLNGSFCAKQKRMREEESSVSVDNEDEWECVCPQGFIGKFCEVISRELSSTTCGDLICQ